MKIKICVVTGSRAEYGLLYPLLKLLAEDKAFNLSLIATGMHLSSAFGNTYKEIEKDFKISGKVNMLCPGNSEKYVSKSIGKGIIKFADTFDALKPDLVMVLGDRFEIFAAVVAAFVGKIPIAHIHGGEVTEGAIDDAFRHSITKMSQYHFVAAEEYKKRVVQLGESPDRVFVTGALGIDVIENIELLPKNQLEKALGFSFGDRNILATFHPATLDKTSSEKQFKVILGALNSLENTKIIFTKANADAGGMKINSLIDKYVRANPARAKAFVSMGQLKYLSTMKYADVVLGNSSSGIIEAPAFGIPTVNIGDRQKGRLKAKSIIDVRPKKEEIVKSIKKAISNDFKNLCKKAVNPYGGGDASNKIVKILKQNLNNMDFNKRFYDLNG